ncbi:MAG: hypothetical protein ICV54_00025 [Nostoc sp. C3-bin3]|nr:hypothetical protein [Nostoc sp. C3-bin3]
MNHGTRFLQLNTHLHFTGRWVNSRFSNIPDYPSYERDRYYYIYSTI